MTYFDAHIDEWASLVKDLRLYIAQEFGTIVPSKKQEIVANKAPTPTPKPIVKTPIPQAAPPKPKEEKPVVDLPKKTQEPIIQAMPRPFVKQVHSPLHDVVEKLSVKTVDAPVEEKTLRPSRIVFVSFFPPASEEDTFIQKVASSVSERVAPVEIFIQPDLEACALAFTLCASDEAKAVIFSCPKEEASRLSVWLSYFGDELQAYEEEKEALTAKRKLFSTPFYELNLSSLDKRALWNDLKSFA